MTGALLLDASVWLAALDRDDKHHGASSGLLEAAASGDPRLAALDLTLYEVANIAVVRWRSEPDARRLVDLVLAACPGTIERADADLLRTASALAAEHGITVYDGAYVAASRRRGWILVSADLSDLVAPRLAVLPEQVGADT